MNSKFFITCFLTLFIFLIIGLNYSVNADMGAKPSITINLENMYTDDYLIDLLVYDETGENYNSEMNYNGNGLSKEEIKTLYDINYDGWISEGTRWNEYLLFADCNGNSDHKHFFNYFGTPETYKVIIIFNNGDIRITDVIHRTEMNSEITIDINDMKIIQSENVLFKLKFIMIPLLLTIFIEIIIALIMKLKNIKLILLTNTLTNILLQLFLLYTPLSYLLTFAIMEILIIITEYLIYKKYIKDTSKSKIILYTLLANLVTIILTFIF